MQNLEWDAYPLGAGEYRYWLRTVWDKTKNILVVCMLNPSHATDTNSDRTINRLIGFAGRWGYGGLHVVNLFAWRSPSPNEMFVQPEPIGSENDHYLHDAISLAKVNGGKLLIAWGNDGNWKYKRADAFFDMIRAIGQIKLICLGLTVRGAPKHPMARGKAWVPDDAPQTDFPIP